MSENTPTLAPLSLPSMRKTRSLVVCHRTCTVQARPPLACDQTMQLQLLQGDEAEKLYGPLSDTPCTGLQGGCMKECPWKAHQALFQGAGAFNLCLQLIESWWPSWSPQRGAHTSAEIWKYFYKRPFIFKSLVPAAASCLNAHVQEIKLTRHSLNYERSIPGRRSHRSMCRRRDFALVLAPPAHNMRQTKAQGLAS